jgi:NAD-dependent dihydropyrimidine dehydrogenase PreA subunit
MYGLRTCSYMCPSDAIRLTEKKKVYMEYPEDCMQVEGCFLCIDACSVEAISWKAHHEKMKLEFIPDFAREERERAWSITEE